MKVKYFAALAAASVFGMTALTSCGEPEVETVEPDAAEVEVDIDEEPDVVAPDATAPDATTEEADPCAAE